MYKFIRMLIAISLVMGIVLLARARVAWANHSVAPSLSAENHEMQSLVPAPGVDCNKDKDKDKDKKKPDSSSKVLRNP